MLNRELALRSIAQAISQTRAQGDACGVLVVRVLRLRETEQMLGYEAMDRLADAARGQIAAALRPADTLVQIGECDFLVILPNLRNQQQTQLAAAKIARVLNMPLAAGNTPIRALYAIGGAVCMCEDEHAEQLCLRADAACNRAMQTHLAVSSSASRPMTAP